MNLEVGARNLTKFWASLEAQGDLLVWATRTEPDRSVVPGETMVFMFAGEPIAVSKLVEILPPGIGIDGQWKDHWKLIHRKNDFLDLRSTRSRGAGR